MKLPWAQSYCRTVTRSSSPFDCRGNSQSTAPSSAAFSPTSETKDRHGGFTLGDS
jgi:hypothetical protein